jgi:glycosyltransferase involved in cell wall biosynthesis
MEKDLSVMRPLISIIIPVYNAEEHLVRCLDSIFTQNFNEEYEVIAVDDGSTDGSLAILKKTGFKMPQLRVIQHEHNSSVNVARSTGIKTAVGEYIMFVDSDDYLMPNALEFLKLKIQAYDADIFIFNYCREFSSGKRSYSKDVKKTLLSSNKLNVQQYFSPGALWSRMYKKSVFEKITPHKNYLNHGEDILYSTEALIFGSSFLLLDKCLYVYSINENSLNSSLSNDIMITSLEEITRELSVILNIFNQTSINQYLYDLRIRYAIDFVCRNFVFLRRNKFDITPLITALEKFPNGQKTKINIAKLSGSYIYFTAQVFMGRITVREIYHFLIGLIESIILTDQILKSKD